MIDIHCHLIPCIDDGSQSIEETIQMVQKADKIGYEGIFATPHYIESAHETQSDDIQEKVKQLNALLESKGINCKIYVGNEVYFTSEILELLQTSKVCTLGGSKYVLVEFPLNGTALNMESVITNICQVGYVPVIAHPERYEFVHKDIKKLLPLIEEGALLQINVGSISGYYGNITRKTVIKLLKKNMVHLIGTDSHNSSSIYDIWEDSIKKIEKIVKKDRLQQMLIENSKSILKDEVIDVWSPKK